MRGSRRAAAHNLVRDWQIDAHHPIFEKTDSYVTKNIRDDKGNCGVKKRSRPPSMLKRLHSMLRYLHGKMRYPPRESEFEFVNNALLVLKNLGG